MRRLLVLILTALVLVLAACGDDDDSTGSEAGGATTAAETTPAQTAPAEEEPASGCKQVDEPAPKEDGNLSKPTFRPEKGKTYTWVLETNCGTVEIRLATGQAPKTTGSIISLTRKGFYDGLIFHRVIDGFVAQGGDPLGQGTGGPGYSVEEAPPSDLTYDIGVVAMAKTGAEPAGTSGSQFFIVTGPAAAQSLTTPDYALVGRVSKGKDVADRIGKVPSDPNTGDRPIEPVVIEKATVRTS